MQYVFEDRQSYFLVTVSGLEEGVPDLYDYIDAIVTHCKQHDCRQVLLDERQVDMCHDAGDDLEIAMSEHANKLVEQFDKVACVGQADRYAMVLRFELFAQKRGLNFRGFKTIASAEKWLLED